MADIAPLNKPNKSRLNINFVFIDISRQNKNIDTKVIIKTITVVMATQVINRGEEFINNLPNQSVAIVKFTQPLILYLILLVLPSFAQKQSYHI